MCNTAGMLSEMPIFSNYFVNYVGNSKCRLSIWNGSGQGTYPSQPRYLPLAARSRGRGYPKVPTPPPQVRMGGPWDRTAYGVLDMLLSLCLLRSCRRTFLFQFVSSHPGEAVPRPRWVPPSNQGRYPPWPGQDGYPKVGTPRPR